MTKNTGPLTKMCGMTREADAELAISLGADAIGLLFYEKSLRFVATDQAALIADAVADGGLKVGLFVDADADTVNSVLAKVSLDILQFHGNESPEYCQGFGLPYWKTVRARDASQLSTQVAAYPQAKGILLDSWHPTKAGGTGEIFDWSFIESLDRKQPLILAGGLNPGNVRSAVERVKPWAVDVCSGIESSPGIKSGQLMKQFIEEVRRV